MPQGYILSRNQKCKSLRVSLITSQPQIKSALKRQSAVLSHRANAVLTLYDLAKNTHEHKTVAYVLNLN